MLKEERQQFILGTLRRDGKVVATDLGAALGVSEDTVRRDLRELSEAGKLLRVHGGALPRSPVVARHDARERQAPAAKAAIARAAAGLVRDGQVIILDGGTTTLQVVQHLPPTLRATIVTNSPPIAVALADHEHVEVVVLGGRLLKESLVTLGGAPVETLRLIRADLCLLGVDGLHPEVGISNLDMEETYVKRAMIASAAEVAAVADAGKLGAAAPYVVGPLDLLTHLVTERAATEEALAPFRALGITLIVG